MAAECKHLLRKFNFDSSMAPSGSVGTGRRLASFGMYQSHQIHQLQLMRPASLVSSGQREWPTGIQRKCLEGGRKREGAKAEVWTCLRCGCS